MSGALDDCYDYALLGTSLPLAILSAALAKAGHSVLHIDDNEHYGGPWASLTLKELCAFVSKFVERRAKHAKRSGAILDASVAFPAYGSESAKAEASVEDKAQSKAREADGIPEQLRALDRHFAISLSPTLLPCSGPTIDVLIRSKVASYCTFRLLQQTALYSHDEEQQAEVLGQNAVESRSSPQSWPLRKVPSSKEDIFKDKSLSLVAKRKLMKLLQQASEQGKADDVNAPFAADRSFLQYLTSSDGPALPDDLARHVAFGVALCSGSSDPAGLAMQRIQRHISSIGKFGNSAYLIGQYGGAGEMAQCYSRASAVQGSVFVLGHQVSRLERIEQAQSQEGSQTGLNPRMRWRLGLEGIESETSVNCVVADADLLDRSPIMTKDTPLPSSGRQAVGILLLDRALAMNDPGSGATEDGEQDAETSSSVRRPPETGLVIFPPEKDDDVTTWAILMGEGTFSCPKGTYLVYLVRAVTDEAKSGKQGRPSARLESASDASSLLKKARSRVLRLTGESKPELEVQASKNGAETSEPATNERQRVQPLMECYFVRQTVPQASSPAARHAVDEQLKMLAEHSFLRVDSPLGDVATSLDDATLQAEDLYWLLTSGRRSARGGADDKPLTSDNVEARRHEARSEAEAMRRRLWRRGYTVGRGLGGTVDEVNAISGRGDEGDRPTPSAVCDFFPVDEDIATGGADDD